jgi:hypothetical protein
MLLEQQIRTTALEPRHKLPHKALNGLLALSMQDYYTSIVSINVSARMLAEIHDLGLQLQVQHNRSLAESSTCKRQQHSIPVLNMQSPRNVHLAAL